MSSEEPAEPPEEDAPEPRKKKPRKKKSRPIQEIPADPGIFDKELEKSSKDLRDTFHSALESHLSSTLEQKKKELKGGLVRKCGKRATKALLLQSRWKEQKALSNLI